MNGPWECFHCGFKTSDPQEATAHFGDRDDAQEFTPTCQWWQRMDEGERAQEFQTLIQELNAERDQYADHLAALREAKSALEGCVAQMTADLKGMAMTTAYKADGAASRWEEYMPPAWKDARAALERLA